jgi:hypothetical protein
VLQGGVLTLDASLRLEVLKDGWVRLPLWTQGSVLRFVGDGAMLNRNGNATEVLARGPRSYRLSARLVFEAPRRPGENRLTLQLPDAPVNLLDVAAGTGLLDLEVASGLSYRALQTRVYAALVGGRATLSYTVPYQTREAEGGEEIERTPRVLLTGYQFMHLGDGVVSGILVQDFDVRVAEVSSFDIGLDEGIEVFDATGPGIESWKVLQGDAGRVLRVTMASPVKEAVRLIVSFDGSYDMDTGAVTVPRFPAIGVERESGFVAVAADGAEVELELGGSLLPADVSEIPPEVLAYGGNLIAAFKYAGPPDDARVLVTDHDDAAVLTAIVERLNASTVLMANGTEATWLDLAVKNNRKQFLKLDLTEGDVEVWSLLVDGQPARPKRSEAQVLVPLPTGTAERISQLSLVLLRRGREVPIIGTARPSLPNFDVPISEAMWTIYLPEGRRYRAVGREFRVLGVTAPLVGGELPGSSLVGLGRLSSRSVLDEAAQYVSEGVVEKQKAQQDQIQQQMAARQGARRRGSLPVRINLPGGVGSLPTVTAARILIVDEGETVLPIRIYPGWSRSALRWTQLLLILVAGVLIALRATARLPRIRARWIVLVTLAAILPVGGIAVIPAGLLIVSIAAAAALIAAVLTRRRARSQPGTEELELEPIEPEPDQAD